VTDLRRLLGARLRALPHGVVFAILEVRLRTILVWDEAERRERVIPRYVIEEALRRHLLIYLGQRRRRSA
jgi:hypothetical protein